MKKNSKKQIAANKIIAKQNFLNPKQILARQVARYGLATALMIGTAQPLFANPTGGEVVHGDITINNTSATKTDIHQTSQKGIINWQSFNIGVGEHTQFHQPSANAITLNRVIGQNPSEILGKLSSNGKIMLVNPDGILFGKSAVVDVGSLLATTHDISNENFIKGDYHFNQSGNPNASIVNLGQITIADRGLAALVAPSVRNDGAIIANLGKVGIGASSKFRVDMYGDGLISFEVGEEIISQLYDMDGNQIDRAIENNGTISANGGKVILTAHVAEQIVDRAISNDGIIVAQSAHMENGEIVLSGGKGSVASTGELDVSGETGADGGSIEISGTRLALGGNITADGENGGEISLMADQHISLAEAISAKGRSGKGGDLSYHSQGSILEIGGSNHDASGYSDGGTISVYAKERIYSSGDYKADGMNGDGGQIDMTADGRVALLSADISAKGGDHGGLVRLGGDYQGGKAQDENDEMYNRFMGRFGSLDAMTSANEMMVNDGTKIDVSGTNGVGGTAIIWSDEQTTMIGEIDASGYTQGGAIEISSKGDLRQMDLLAIDLSAQHGDAGDLLLDPKNIIIGERTEASAWSYQMLTDLPTLSSEIPSDYRLGASLAMSADGTKLAIGATDGPYEGGSGAAGVVYLITFSDSDYSDASLESIIGKGYGAGKTIGVDTLTEYDGFGSSLAMSNDGTKLAVGNISGEVGTTLSNSGDVYLFTFSDENFSGGQFQDRIGHGFTDINNNTITLEANDNFGSSLAMNSDGTKLAVGARGGDGAAGSFSSGSGEVYLFTFSGSDFSGGQFQGIMGNGYSGGKDVNVTLETQDVFGYSLAMSGDGKKLAVGARGGDGKDNPAGLSNSGEVYLFTFSDTEFSNAQLQGVIGHGYTGGKNVDVALDGSDYFGTSLAMNDDGTRLAVGIAQGKGFGNSVISSGEVYLYTFNDDNFSNGRLMAKIGHGYLEEENFDIPLQANDLFGSSLTMNGDGTRLAVGYASFNNKVSFIKAPALMTGAASISYNAQTGSDMTIFASDIAYTLSLGTNLILQASNDITLNNPILIEDTYLTWGSLSLLAGRSILLKESINSHNGDVNLTINDYLSNGVVDGDRESGDAEFSLASGKTINVGTGDVTINIRMGDDKTHSGVASTATKENIETNITGSITANKTTINDEPTAHDININAKNEHDLALAEKNKAETARDDAQDIKDTLDGLYSDIQTEAGKATSTTDANAHVNNTTAAKNNATTAANDANSALNDATTIYDDFDETSTDYDEIITTAGEIDAILEQARQAYEEAKTQATMAQNEANTAKGIAETETTAANNARTKSDEINTLHPDISPLVNTADTAKTAADTRAGEVEGLALDATDAAPDYHKPDDADTLAGDARGYATDAETAYDIANTALTDAATIKDTAANLATTAETYAQAEANAIIGIDDVVDDTIAQRNLAWDYYQQIKAMSSTLYAMAEALLEPEIDPSLMAKHANYMQRRNFLPPNAYRMEEERTRPRIRNSRDAITEFEEQAHRRTEQRYHAINIIDGDIILTPNPVNEEE